MLITLTLLSLVSWIPYGDSIYHACIPNSQFLINGRLCRCDPMGRWNEASCYSSRRQICKPGQVIWQDCSQCICQEDGHMICTNTMCGDETTRNPNQIKSVIDVKRMWCIPFVSYYVNCSLCVCPASGKMNEARCATDATCPFRQVTDYKVAVKNNICIPKVMYLFPCLHCLCSDDGFFIVRKCVETCQQTNMLDAAKRCTPRTFYKSGCNVCFCPESGKTDKNLCTKSVCNHRNKLDSLENLKNKTWQCEKQMFTGPKCFYCECSHEGTINEKVCLELECLSTDNFKYNFEKANCTPGEMVPKCIDCLCLRNGSTHPHYCTKICSNQQKLSMLEITYKQSLNNDDVFDIQLLHQPITEDECVPNSIYKEKRQICVCPEDGDINPKLCTSEIEERHSEKAKISIKETAVDIDFSIKCNPNTFVEFDCNTCYCLKTGRIDPKWCTYDDCKAKRLVLEKQKNERGNVKIPNSQPNAECVPGSISKVECNFCICPESGKYKERACTKNTCIGVHTKVSQGLSCEPLAYYNVDCNICYCPKNGVKNVAKCTKNTCEKNFLRSDICVPGKLFSEECNVCICPPNGDKADRVCTNITCADSDTPWKKIYQLSQSLLSYQKMADTTKDLELCFPGEEFEVGCKVCLCPDMGLRMYATCTQMLCNNEHDIKEPLSDLSNMNEVQQTRRDVECPPSAMIGSKERFECTPGSMYIIRCRQCICPYMGDIEEFCRPLPDGFYCEQAYPYANLPKRRRNNDKANGTTIQPPASVSYPDGVSPKIVSHKHTAWSCDEAGRVMDECFICECKNGVIIQEHCFRSDSKNCFNSTPSFLKEIILPEG